MFETDSRGVGCCGNCVRDWSLDTVLKRINLSFLIIMTLVVKALAGVNIMRQLISIPWTCFISTVAIT